MPGMEKVIDCLQAALRMRNEHGFCILPFETVEDALELLKAQEPGWISVKDRLPAATDDFVLFTVGGDVFYGNYDGKDWYKYEGDWETDVIYLEPGERITHWMPLPEPPKEGT